jgi:excinuclease ABC subunit C
VGYISEPDYARDVDLTRLFYQGKNEAVIDELMARMDEASRELHFEEAAQYRDQIARMRDIVQKQVVESTSGDIDVFGLARTQSNACIFVLFVRQGLVLGDQRYYQAIPMDYSDSELMTTFLSQYYLDSSQLPSEILVKVSSQDRDLLQKAITFQTRQKVKIGNSPREKRAHWLELASRNAITALESRLSSDKTQQTRFEALKELIGLDSIQRMECFDISHTSGEQTVASCVVFGPESPVKSLYRRFNIEGITGGDDFAAMHQVLERRYRRVKAGEIATPDVLIIDGGKGQLSQAEDVLEQLGVDIPCIIAIAKGRTRKAGFEQLIMPGMAAPLMLEATDPALHLLQHIRDESHRFAISGHRAARAKQKRTSTLEQIPGVGAARRRELLRRFGGLDAVKKASTSDLAKIPGISSGLAQRIHDYLHED